MKKIVLLTALLVLFPLAGTTFAGIPGATDRVPAATLLVPFFEVGISSAQDTLLVVNDVSFDSSTTIHYEVWDIDGSPAEIWGNVTLGPAKTWSVSMGDLISAASSASKTQLTDGAFYHGFVTIDRVTSSTDYYPTDSAYPFSNYNYLDGYIYYVRLLEGSSNGLSMVPIEYVGSSVDHDLRDFYQNSDGREEIDSDGRVCASNLINGGTCTTHDYIFEIHSRVFLLPSMSAASRIIVFTWEPGRTGGPSQFCSTSGLCDTTYTYERYDEAGNTEQATTISLNHVVNVINVTGTENGWVSIWDVPSTVGDTDFQIYAFSFNSASSSTISTNWDAIFESYIWP